MLRAVEFEDRFLVPYEVFAVVDQHHLAPQVSQFFIHQQWCLDIRHQHRIFQLFLELDNHFEPLLWLHFPSSFRHNQKHSLILPIVLQKCINIDYDTLQGDPNAGHHVAPVITHVLSIFDGHSQVEVPDACLQLPQDVFVLVLHQPLQEGEPVNDHTRVMASRHSQFINPDVGSDCEQPLHPSGVVGLVATLDLVDIELEPCAMPDRVHTVVEVISLHSPGIDLATRHQCPTVPTALNLASKVPEIAHHVHTVQLLDQLQLIDRGVGVQGTTDVQVGAVGAEPLVGLLGAAPYLQGEGQPVGDEQVGKGAGARGHACSGFQQAYEIQSGISPNFTSCF